MKFRSRVYRLREEEGNFWPAFVDIMTAMCLVFFFVMIVVVGMTALRDKKADQLKDRLDNISKERNALYQQVDEILKESPIKDSYELENGKFSIKSDILFPFASARLDTKGVVFAQEVGKAFFQVLDEDGIRSKIRSIEVIGHTDYIGDGISNRSLSSERAANFVNAMLPSGSREEQEFGKYIKTSGMSKFDPAYGDLKNQTDEERSKNRRIEIIVNFDNKDIEDAVEEYRQSLGKE